LFMFVFTIECLEKGPARKHNIFSRFHDNILYILKFVCTTMFTIGMFYSTFFFFSFQTQKV